MTSNGSRIASSFSSPSFGFGGLARCRRAGDVGAWNFSMCSNLWRMHNSYMRNVLGLICKANGLQAAR
jgi:hypothetical protein